VLEARAQAAFGAHDGFELLVYVFAGSRTTGDHRPTLGATAPRARGLVAGSATTFAIGPRAFRYGSS